MNQIQIITDVITQFFYRVNPHMNSGYFKRSFGPFFMTKN